MAKLIINDLALSYGLKTVLEDVVIPEIKAGSLVSVLGPNGVGKSTFLRALAGLQPWSGQISLNGEDLKTMPGFRRSGLIGYMPQQLPQATTLIAYEAVISACRAVRPDLSGKIVERLCEEVFSALGIRHLAFQALNKLSGGQRQMIGLSQVIVRKPELMLLDEPTSALDLRWQLGVLKVVRTILKEQKGICLMALHDINLALRHSDYVILFGGGSVISFGPPSRAMTSENLRKAFLVDGRVETCSRGHPFIITDGAIAVDSLGQFEDAL